MLHQNTTVISRVTMVRTEGGVRLTVCQGDKYGETDFSITSSSNIFLNSGSMTLRALNRTGYPFDLSVLTSTA